jgi:MFS family permease
MHRCGTFSGWLSLMPSCLLLCCSWAARSALYGRRKIFVVGVPLFTAGSACGVDSSINTLIIARARDWSGLARAGKLSHHQRLVFSRAAGRAIGTWSGFTAITAAIGPVLGKLLVQNGSWRWVFIINLPLALIVVWLAWWRVPESRNEEASQTLDWPVPLWQPWSGSTHLRSDRSFSRTLVSVTHVRPITTCSAMQR